MRVAAKQFALVLFESLHQTSPTDQDKVLDNFVQMLSDHGGLGMWDEIEAEFENYRLEQQGKIPAQVTFSHNADNQKHLIGKLNRLVGENAVLKKKVDDGIIGGFIIETKDERIDASVKKQLDNLKKTLSA